MKIQIELPDKYAEKLEDVEEVEPTIRDQIEIEVLPEVLRLVTDAHRQVQDREAAVVADGDADRPE